jgi:hypothetical protein
MNKVQGDWDFPALENLLRGKGLHRGMRGVSDVGPRRPSGRDDAGADANPAPIGLPFVGLRHRRHSKASGISAVALARHDGVLMCLIAMSGGWGFDDSNAPAERED